MMEVKLTSLNGHINSHWKWPKWRRNCRQHHFTCMPRWLQHQYALVEMLLAGSGGHIMWYLYADSNKWPIMDSVLSVPLLFLSGFLFQLHFCQFFYLRYRLSSHLCAHWIFLIILYCDVLHGWCNYCLVSAIDCAVHVWYVNTLMQSGLFFGVTLSWQHPTWELSEIHGAGF